LVLGPEFRDTTAEAGKTYLYRVTAIDQHHNESTPSTTVKAEIRP
jgi:fibronectin type 3 domain-containing protein